MNQQKPRLCLRIQNLDKSLAFLPKLDWQVEWHNPDQGIAQMRQPDGAGVVLVTDPELDVQAYMDVAFLDKPTGTTFYLTGQDLPAIAARLTAQGVTGLELKETPASYDRALRVPTPSGHIAAFYEALPMPDAAALDLYRRGPDLLEEALVGLSEADLDRTRAPGKWSIRQIALHVIDSDFGITFKLRFALAEPGRRFNANPYSQDKWAEGLDYAGRPVQTEVQLFRLARQHILGLVGHLPGALDRTVQDDKGNATAVRQMLRMVAGHAYGHIQQIGETRRVHGR